MPAFDDSVTCTAPPEEVWKLLYDPVRFPEWWAGVASVSADGDGDGGTRYAYYPEGYPDFPVPQRLEHARAEGRVVISCLLSDMRFRFTLEPLEPDAGTRIAAHVEIPEAEAGRLAQQRETIHASLHRLAALAGDEPRH